MTRMQLSFSEIEAGVGLINKSFTWQDGICFTLCVLYALVSLTSLIQLIRGIQRMPETGWNLWIVFFRMNFIINGVRAFQFGFYDKQVMFLHPKALTTLVLWGLPSLLFFSTYAYILLYLAVTYNQVILLFADEAAAGLSTDTMLKSYIYGNGALYFIQVCIWLDHGSIFVHFLGNLFIAVIAFIVGWDFLHYGGKLCILLALGGTEETKRLLDQIAPLAELGFRYFFIRGFVTVLSAFGADTLPYHPVLYLIYYTVGEILPSALFLYNLRELPPKMEP